MKEVLEKRKDLQVLWKLMPDAAHAEARVELEAWSAKEGGEDGRVKVVDWLKADPPALMQEGWIGAFAHHGGGNSYHESIGYAAFPLLS